MEFCFVEVIKLPEFLQQHEDDGKVTDADLAAWDWEDDGKDVELSVWR